MTDEVKQPNVDDAFVCGNCVHCQEGPNTVNNILSRNCYRYPPTAVVANTPKGPAIISVRPEIQVDTPACGEFETEEGSGMPTVVTS